MREKLKVILDYYIKTFKIFSVPQSLRLITFPYLFFLLDVLRKDYEQLLWVIDKTPPHEDLTYVDTGVNLQEGLVDHNEDAGLTAFLEDFEEDYYSDGDLKGDFINAEDTATSTTAELIYEGAQITYDESLLLTMAFALNFFGSCGRLLGTTSYSLP